MREDKAWRRLEANTVLFAGYRESERRIWWNVYGKPIWEQMLNLERILKEKSSYNKASIVLRDSVKHLGMHNTPCLIYLTFLIRDEILEMGVHFDTNAVEYIQGNMYGLHSF